MWSLAAGILVAAAVLCQPALGERREGGHPTRLHAPTLAMPTPPLHAGTGLRVLVAPCPIACCEPCDALFHPLSLPCAPPYAVGGSDVAAANYEPLRQGPKYITLIGRETCSSRGRLGADKCLRG